MSREQKSIELSEIEYEQERFDMSEASILLDGQKPQLSSNIKKELGNDTANIETRCDKKEQPYAGSFMRELMKFEKEISYESEAYDIYEAVGTSTSEYRDRAYKILSTSKHSQPKSYQNYIYDFSKQGPNTPKKISATPKRKSSASSPKSPQPFKRVARATEACQQYFGYDTPTSQQAVLNKKKKRSTSKKQKTSNKLIEYQCQLPKRSLSKLSVKSKGNCKKKKE